MNIESIRSNGDQKDGDFFLEAYTFLCDYNWIFRSSNTECLTAGVFDQLPADWAQFCEQLSNDHFNSIPDGLENDPNIPKSMFHFYLRLKQLQHRIDYKAYVPASASLPPQPVHNLKGISQKKLHEIHRFAAEVDSIVANSNPTLNCKNTILIDLGCGLGYVSQLLNQQFGYRVLGIEANAERVRAAQQRQINYYPDSITDVHYVQHFIEDTSSSEFLQQQCELLFGPKAADRSEWRYALVGLHACAALSVTTSNLFLRMQRSRVLAIMPCCYHKMFDGGSAAQGDSSHDYVRHNCIPLSEAMIRFVRPEKWYANVINIPFLRLACQQCASRWVRMTAQEHNAHGASMWDRAVLQSVVKDGEMLVSRKPRREVPNELFDRWPILQKFALRSKLNGDDITWTDRHYIKAEQMCQLLPKGAYLAELLTGLQATIQFLCEYVVLYDRVCYLNEQTAIDSAELRQIFCDLLSPRSFLLVSQK